MGLDLHTMTDFRQEVGSQIPYSVVPDTEESAVKATEGMLHCEGRSTSTCAWQPHWITPVSQTESIPKGLLVKVKTFLNKRQCG